MLGALQGATNLCAQNLSVVFSRLKETLGKGAEAQMLKEHKHLYQGALGKWKKAFGPHLQQYVTLAPRKQSMKLKELPNFARRRMSRQQKGRGVGWAIPEPLQALIDRVLVERDCLGELHEEIDGPCIAETIKWCVDVYDKACVPNPVIP